MVDSNIIIYAHDPGDPQKQIKAKTFLRQLEAKGELTMSVQTLHEFYSRATKPNRPPALSHTEAQKIIDDLLLTATVYRLEPAITAVALNAITRYQMSLWDALIWAVAKEYGETVIYTEDTQSQPEIEGVRYVNPLLEPSTD